MNKTHHHLFSFHFYGIYMSLSELNIFTVSPISADLVESLMYKYVYKDCTYKK